MKNESQYRKDIVEVCKRMHSRGWISSTDGNVSIKLGPNRILVTPTGIHKGFMSERDLIVVDTEGRLISGKLKPTSEMIMHIACYKFRPDIGSVVHAHPTMCVAFSLAGIKLAKCLLPEVVFTLGSIPTADYAAPSTIEVAESIEKFIVDHDAVILERHGSLTVGKDVFAAYNTLERMEHVAEMTYHARQLGSIEPLTNQQITRLQAIGDAQGWPRKKIVEEACNSCNACGKFSSGSCGSAGQVAGAEESETSGNITESVKQAIGQLPDGAEKIIAEEIEAALATSR